MIKSMTAYGQSLTPASKISSWQIELRTVNSRFFDLHLHLPTALTGLEDRIKKYLRQKFIRGKINLTITSSGIIPPSPRLVLNRGLLREYRQILNDIKQELGTEVDPRLIPSLINRELVLVEENIINLNEQWIILEPALVEAMNEAESMRAAEGAILAKDLTARLILLESLFKKIATCSPELVEKYRQRLRERISIIMENSQSDLYQRLAMEVAIMAERCDITEEIVRSLSHIEQFRTFLQTSEPAGRKLDFLLQEFNREANTMASKSPDASIANYVIQIKTELERMREQVQNIE